MTPPRQILPGQTFEISCRTHGRVFRFLPTWQIKQLMLYVLALGAERYNVSVYGVVLMANHYHLLGRDNDGVLPDFVRYVNSTLARAINALQGRDDGVWSADGYGLLRPQSDEDLVARMVYLMANPVEAGLVRRAVEYPGVVTLPSHVGTSTVIERPDFFFREGGPTPKQVTLRIEAPPGFGGVEAWRQRIAEGLRECERACLKERREAGLGTGGGSKALRVRVGEAPATREQWFRMRPSIAAREKAVRIAAIRALRAFREAYLAAWTRFRDGETDVEFPAGTWWMVRYAGAVGCVP